MTAQLLSFEGVYKSQWRGAHEIAVLSDVSFSVAPGELVAIWGKRGSGKSTLARLAVGLETPDRGEINFRGRPIAESFPRNLHREIGWVRRAGLEAAEIDTVVDQLILPLLDKYTPRQARRRAVAMLELLGIADCSGSSWGSLTDGQRTLVAIAHALIREPTLVVADDPTASLDMLQREEVMRLLRNACDEKELGVLVTVPDTPDMTYADQLAMLSNARLVFPEPGPERGNVIDFPASGSG